ncbi:hypothetical protein [Paraburkholderia jirisanensis]
MQIDRETGRRCMQRRTRQTRGLAHVLQRMVHGGKAIPFALRLHESSRNRMDGLMAVGSIVSCRLDRRHAPGSSVYWQAAADITGLPATQAVLRKTCRRERVKACFIPRRLSLR